MSVQEEFLMAEKVVLILVDGMRPDGMLACGHPFVKELISKSTHALDAQTVYPSVTLPCHMSLFHSVDPERHGILSNDYVPQVRPVTGLVDQLDKYEKKCAFFISWENLRDLSRPDHLHHALSINLHKQADADIKLTDAAIDYIKAEDPDFVFLYLGETDELGGHDNGWMSEPYMQCLRKAFDCIQRVYENLPEGYTLITTADHGGHGRMHGENIPEDMIIPICFCGPRFEEDKAIKGVSIKDIPTTIAKLLNVPRVREWEGAEHC